MKIETVIKTNHSTNLSPEEIVLKLRLFLVRQASQIKVVKVVLSERLGATHQPFLTMYKVEFVTGGTLILETKGDTFGLAFRSGLLRLRRSLENELHRRWIAFDPKQMNKPLKKLIQKVEIPYATGESFRWVKSNP